MGLVFANVHFLATRARNQRDQDVWSDEGGELPKATPADDLGFASKADPLSVREAPGFAAELFEENTIFLLEVFDNRLLASVHPTGDGGEEELQLSCHGANIPSKVAVAQSSKVPRLSFLAVHGRADVAQFSHASGIWISSGLR